MKKARVVAVCTVGLVLALLLGGLPSVDQTHSAVTPDASVVYAAQDGPNVVLPYSNEAQEGSYWITDVGRCRVRVTICWGDLCVTVEFEWDC